jgi:hypothetical protein
MLLLRATRQKLQLECGAVSRDQLSSEVPLAEVSRRFTAGWSNTPRSRGVALGLDLNGHYWSV